jgi:cell pole-organizing protein PopZ
MSKKCPIAQERGCMESKSPEMSLDDVLSSIKQMVINEEPPVLELTDMVSDDGSIVKIKKNSASGGKSADMSSFLKLIQENSDCGNQSSAKNNPSGGAAESSENSENAAIKKIDASPESPLYEIIKEVTSPLLREWINDNLPSLVTKIVETEVRSFLYKSASDYKIKNFPG